MSSHSPYQMDQTVFIEPIVLFLVFVVIVFIIICCSEERIRNGCKFRWYTGLDDFTHNVVSSIDFSQQKWCRQLQSRLHNNTILKRASTPLTSLYLITHHHPLCQWDSYMDRDHRLHTMRLVRSAPVPEGLFTTLIKCMRAGSYIWF